MCEGCGEEIMNGREVRRAGRRLCPGACAGPVYYSLGVHPNRPAVDIIRLVRFLRLGKSSLAGVVTCELPSSATVQQA